MNPGKSPRAASGVPNPRPVSMRSVDIYAANLHNGRCRLVEPDPEGDCWMEIDDQHIYQLEDLE